MKSLVLVCAFVLVVCVQFSEQCTCMWGYVKVSEEEVPMTLCYSDKYVVAKVESKHRIPGPSGYDDIDGRMRFDVIMTSMITRSGSDSFEGGKKTSLIAPIGSSLCGYIDFELGKTYYVSVYEDSDKKLRFNGCSFGRTEDKVTEVQRKLMRGELQCPKDTIESVVPV